MPREIGIWSYKLRDWQDECFRLVVNAFTNGKKDFLANVTPAGGKTTFALRTAFRFLQLRDVQRIVVVVHTEHLKKQWALSAARFGIDLDPNFQNNGKVKETADYHGVCITYQQIGLNSVLHRYAVDNYKTLVIFDEIHHAGDEKSWGTGIQTAFENAVFRLSLTGTAFRSDNNPIPFVTYEGGISKPDYRYSYAKAITDKVCRIIYFPAYDGVMEWKYEGKSYKHNFADEVTDSLVSQRLRTALDPNSSKWLEHVLRDANEKLEEIREKEGHPDAGGLIFAMDQQHAKDIAKLLIRICDETAAIVISEDKFASRRIKKFAESKKKWIIAVKMISEGVDIPRLRVGVYATNVKKDLFFRQAVGRFIRWTQSLSKQDAYLFIPKDRDIVKLAREIEIERDHALNQQEFENESTEQNEREQKDFEAISAKVTGKTQFALSLNERIANMFSAPAESVTTITEAVIEKREEEQQQPAKAVFERMEELRAEINIKAKLAAKKKFAGNGRIDWDYFHRVWINEKGGKKIELETIPELERRSKWLDNWM